MGVQGMPASYSERRIARDPGRDTLASNLFRGRNGDACGADCPCRLLPAWTQLLHPLATIIAKSKLLVVPVYPAAWPQAKKHPFVQVIFRAARAIQRVNAIRKISFRYRQAETASSAAVERLERTAGLASAVSWLRKAHVAEHLGVEQRTRKLRSFFSRWSIKFSAEYYEAKEREASGASSSSNNATSVSSHTSAKPNVGGEDAR